jgi:Transposase C of IS166 homeodomain
MDLRAHDSGKAEIYGSLILWPTYTSRSTRRRWAAAQISAAFSSRSSKVPKVEGLRFQIARLRRMQFDRSSGRIAQQIEQLELQLEELETRKPRMSPRPPPTNQTPLLRTAHRYARVVETNGRQGVTR